MEENALFFVIFGNLNPTLKEDLL